MHIYFIGGGGQGAFPSPLNFYNPKRSQIWRGAISRCVAQAAKCESAAIDFWIFFKPFGDVLWNIWISEPRGVGPTERSTIVDLLIKIHGPLNPAAYWKVHNLFKGPKFVQKRSKISNAPPPLEIWSIYPWCKLCLCHIIGVEAQLECALEMFLVFS